MQARPTLDHVLMGWNGSALQLLRAFKHHTCNHSAASQDHCCERVQNHTQCILKLFIVLQSSFQNHNFRRCPRLFQSAHREPFLIKWGSHCKPSAGAASLRFIFLHQPSFWLSFCFSFWFAATAAVLKGERAYQQHPVYVHGSGRVSEKYFMKKKTILDGCSGAISWMDGSPGGVRYRAP